MYIHGYKRLLEMSGQTVAGINNSPPALFLNVNVDLPLMGWTVRFVSFVWIEILIKNLYENEMIQKHKVQEFCKLKPS